MPLFNRAVTAGWLALLGAYFLWWRLSEYDREPKPVRVRARWARPRNGSTEAVMSQNSGPARDATDLCSQTETDEQRVRDEEIDEASAQSFPASDSPSSTSAHAGPPIRLDSSAGAHPA